MSTERSAKPVDLEAEELEEMRHIPASERMALGGILFDDMVRRMRDGIRHLHPEYSSEEVETLLIQQLDANRSGD